MRPIVQYLAFPHKTQFPKLSEFKEKKLPIYPDDGNKLAKEISLKKK